MSKYHVQEVETWPDFRVEGPNCDGTDYELTDSFVKRFQTAQRAYYSMRAELMDLLEQYDEDAE